MNDLNEAQQKFYLYHEPSSKPQTRPTIKTNPCKTMTPEQWFINQMAEAEFSQYLQLHPVRQQIIYGLWKKQQVEKFKLLLRKNK